MHIISFLCRVSFSFIYLFICGGVCVCFYLFIYLNEKAEGRDGDATRVLLEDVHDSIADMVQIIQSYRSKNMVSRVFVSSLFKKRQEEAEESINACLQRLQVHEHERTGVSYVRRKLLCLVYTRPCFFRGVISIQYV